MPINQDHIRAAIAAENWRALVYYTAADCAAATGYSVQDCQNALDQHFQINPNGGGETQAQFAVRCKATWEEQNAQERRQNESPTSFEAWIAGNEEALRNMAASAAFAGSKQDQSGHDGAPAGLWSNVSAGDQPARAAIDAKAGDAFWAQDGVASFKA